VELDGARRVVPRCDELDVGLAIRAPVHVLVKPTVARITDPALADVGDGRRRNDEQEEHGEGRKASHEDLYRRERSRDQEAFERGAPDAG
jgi:hypothetical protein